MKFFKKPLLLILVSLLPGIASYAQDTLKGESGAVYTNRQIGLPNPLPLLPRFPGGNDSLISFIKRNTHYPKKALKHNISGIVKVYFTVTVDGSIKNPKVLNHLGYGCDEEAIRVVNLMPKWIPATKGRAPIELNSHVNIPFGK